MGQVGRILIADDEETFSHSTADLLRQEGYECDCVPDAAVGIEKLSRNNYDLLIADIKMPGNRDLEFVQDLPNLAEGTPAIIVTGYPSRKSAIQAVGLPVVAYMVKPIDFKQLLENVNIAIAKSHFYQTLANIRRRLQYWQKRLADIEENLNGKPTSSSVKSFLELTVENAIGILAEIKEISGPKEDVNRLACRLLDCPTKNELVGAVEETIKALEKTKGAFKSKELGTVRKKLEDVLENARKN